jgi:hypothetical protein
MNLVESGHRRLEMVEDLEQVSVLIGFSGPSHGGDRGSKPLGTATLTHCNPM